MSLADVLDNLEPKWLRNSCRLVLLPSQLPFGICGPIPGQLKFAISNQIETKCKQPSRNQIMQTQTNNATENEQHNCEQTAEPRTNIATAEQSNRNWTMQPRTIILGCVVRLQLHCSIAIALFDRGCVVRSWLRCSFVVDLNQRYFGITGVSACLLFSSMALAQVCVCVCVRWASACMHASWGSVRPLQHISSGEHKYAPRTADHSHDVFCLFWKNQCIF